MSRRRWPLSLLVQISVRDCSRTGRTSVDLISRQLGRDCDPLSDGIEPASLMQLIHLSVVADGDQGSFSHLHGRCPSRAISLER
jgi:hypothetical protein